VKNIITPDTLLGKLAKIIENRFDDLYNNLNYIHDYTSSLKTYELLKKEINVDPDTLKKLIYLENELLNIEMISSNYFYKQGIIDALLFLSALINKNNS